MFLLNFSENHGSKPTISNRIGLTLSHFDGYCDSSTGLEQNRYILDAFFGRNEQSTSRPDWLTSLLEQLQQS